MLDGIVATKALIEVFIKEIRAQSAVYRLSYALTTRGNWDDPGSDIASLPQLFSTLPYTAQTHDVIC